MYINDIIHQVTLTHPTEKSRILGRVALIVIFNNLLNYIRYTISVIIYYLGASSLVYTLAQSQGRANIYLHKNCDTVRLSKCNNVQ